MNKAPASKHRPGIPHRRAEPHHRSSVQITPESVHTASNIDTRPDSHSRTDCCRFGVGYTPNHTPDGVNCVGLVRRRKAFGQRVFGFSGCSIAFEPFGLYLVRCSVAKGRVEPYLVVPQLDIACDVLSRLLAGRILRAMYPLVLQGSVERFRPCVVEADAGPSDGPQDLY